MMILLEGMHGAGKSTFAEKWITENPSYTIVRGYCKNLTEVATFLETYKDQDVVIDRLFIIPFMRNNFGKDMINQVLHLLNQTAIDCYMFLCDADKAWERSLKKDYPIIKEEFDTEVNYSIEVFTSGIVTWKLINIDNEENAE